MFAERFLAYLAELNDLRRFGASEAAIRDAFLRFLRDAFPGLDQADRILLERHIPAVHARGGFADALFGDIIFEFKRRLDDQSRADGIEKLARYIRNQRNPEKYLGILTDGELLETYALKGDALVPIGKCDLDAERASEAQLWLDCHLFHEKQLPPTADDVVARFGQNSPTFWHSLRVLEGMWQRVRAGAANQTKVGEWQSLLSIVYSSPVGEEKLFLRHTFLALFARVLAFIAVEQRAPDSRELAGIITGKTFERIGFGNFVEEDFFAWVNSPETAAEAKGLLCALATRLTVAYDLRAIHYDLLRELYQELVDPETRHDLGEFYTPDWLAELTLREAGFPPENDDEGEPVLLDPACGSGTFFLAAIRLLRAKGLRGNALVEYCTQRLVAIDVHPLAVAIAKTNLVLALGDDIRHHSSNLVLPVYMADSLTFMQPALSENVVRVAVDVDAISSRSGKHKTRNLPAVFDLPSDLAENPETLQDAVGALLDYSSPDINDRDAQDGLSERLAAIGVRNGNGHLWRSNLILMRWLLQAPATNSVWRFVLRNAYQPELQSRRKFPFVVGNPPWLSYRFIKRRDYQQRVRELVFQYGLANRRALYRSAFGNMEIATLFCAFSYDRYLKPDGTLAFVMPRSIMTGAKQHTAFRSQILSKSHLLIDCEKVDPLFNVPTCAVFLRKTETEMISASVPRRILSGTLPQRNASLQQAQSLLKWDEACYSPAPSGEPSSKCFVGL
jgi:hypothetical protein